MIMEGCPHLVPRWCPCLPANCGWGTAIPFSHRDSYRVSLRKRSFPLRGCGWMEDQQEMLVENRLWQYTLSGNTTDVIVRKSSASALDIITQWYQRYDNTDMSLTSIMPELPGWKFVDEAYKNA
eukprot:363888-Chlamydomonas_euryale.AAC.4